MKTVSRLSQFMLVVGAVTLNMGPAWEITTPSANAHIGYNETIYGGGTGATSASIAFNAYKGTSDYLNGETGTVDQYGNWDLIIATPPNGWNDTQNPFNGELHLKSGGTTRDWIPVVFDGMPPP